MKKIISVAVALCIAITSLFTSVYAMADSKVTSGDIKKKLNDTAIYLLSEKKEDFSVNNVKNLVAYINAGIDVNDYKDEFTKSVKENLESNSGKIVAVVGYDENNGWAPIKGESAGIYANVIIALDYFGFDVKNFEGINLVENFKNVKLNKDHENQYLFSSIFAVAEKYGLADTLKTAQNFLLNNYYEFGTGSTYYTSTDSDAQLVVALAPYSNKYKSVIDDTLNCMESYKADGGYLYNLDKVYNYNTKELEDPVISGNSTGLALAAYSAVNNFDKAQKIYNEIVNSFECKDVKGAYAYTAGGDENALNAGPSLMFITLPNVFKEMLGGQIVGAVFFLLVVLAAMTSSISLMETVVSIVEERFHWKRIPSCLIVTGISFLIGLLSVFGYSIWSDFTIFHMQFLDFFDYISNNIMMPIVALMTCVLVGFVVKTTFVEDEIEKNTRFRAKGLYRVMIKFICPICMLLILFSALFLKL